MKSKQVNLRFGAVSLLIVLAAMSRLAPHPPNFSPVGGMALFGAAYYSRRCWAFAIPILAMWVSDLALNNIVYAQYFDGFVWFYSGALFTYGAFAAVVLLGMLTLKKVRVGRVAAAALGASVVFFLVSNFGVWLAAGMYPHTPAGLAACYAAGIPFFQNTIAGDLVYTAAMFGAFEWGARKLPQLRLQKISPK
ncbi:MAG: hypothetical protein LBK18_06420 [Prevotellaceae bacterium]|jgi:hypothetical protein|nr:hypothetical protein [Prevotellaceae bacterium]